MAILIKSQTAKEDKNFWGTTVDCFLDAQFLNGRKFAVDVAAEPSTAKVDRFYVSTDYFDLTVGSNDSRGSGSTLLNSSQRIVGIDALNLSWENDYWCNPPFDLKLKFIKHAVKQLKSGIGGMMLLPYEPITAWWLENVEPFATAIYEPDGRYNFVQCDGVTKKTGVNFGSAFVLFTPHMTPLSPPRIRFKRGISKIKESTK